MPENARGMDRSLDGPQRPRRQQAERVGDGQGARPVPHAELAEQPGLHVLHGLRRDAQGARGLPDGVALGLELRMSLSLEVSSGSPTGPVAWSSYRTGRPRAAGASAWN